MEWIKASYSFANGNCVEIAVTDDPAVIAACGQEGESALYLVRNSNNQGGGTLAFTRTEIQVFFAAVKAGEFDDLAGITRSAT